MHFFAVMFIIDLKLNYHTNLHTPAEMHVICTTNTHRSLAFNSFHLLKKKSTSPICIHLTAAISDKGNENGNKAELSNIGNHTNVSIRHIITVKANSHMVELLQILAANLHR